MKVHAYLNTPIRYNAYQYLPLLNLRENRDRNLLITDEVGLGKTIEAGIIIDDFLQKPDRTVIVICPVFLKNKWHDELQQKFYYFSHIFTGKEESIDENLIIVPVSKLRDFCNWLEEFNEQELLIVVDEAHYFRNSSSARYRNLQFILQNLSSAKLVFMTATPINNNRSDFENVFRLLGNQLKVTNTTKLQAYIDLKQRNVQDIQVDLTDRELAVYQEIDDRLEPFAGTVYRHVASGCLKSALDYISSNSTFSDETIAEMFEYLSLENDLDHEQPFNAHFQIDADLPNVDTKLQELFKLIRKHPNEKIVIFAHYTKTIEYLYGSILRYFRENAMNKENVGFIHGNKVSRNLEGKIKKNRFIDAKAWFDRGTGQKIFICSDACKEGVDLDKGSVLINYDLPFNPANIEQRIGRIDRMSQKQDMVIYNFHVNNTYDDRLNAIINLKLRYIAEAAKHGIGNPLNISEDRADVIIDKFIKYFERREYSNEDVEILRSVLRKIGIKVPRLQKNEKGEYPKTDKNELKRLVNENRIKIIQWLSTPNNPIERDILVNDYNNLDNKLKFDKTVREVELIVNCQMKYEIINSFDNGVESAKYLSFLKNYEEYYHSLEEYGERKQLVLDDIVDRLVINYVMPDEKAFVPYEIVERLVSRYEK